MNYNPFTLSGKQILVTGASSGIGRSIAIECSRMGATLIITGRNQQRLNETLSLLEKNNHKGIVADISNEKGILTLIEQIDFVNGIVLNAGINIMMPVKFITLEKMETVFRTNLFAPILVTQKLLKGNKISKNASIVIISSIASNRASISNAIYSSSKGALNSFSRVLALELASKKIRVNSIQPGIINTEILKAHSLQKDLSEYEKKYPLDGFGKPEDVAYASIYLLSDASKWVTGSIFTIDGGVTLR